MVDNYTKVHVFCTYMHMYVAAATFVLLLGTYHQYDTIAYPKKTIVAKTWAGKAKATMAAIGGLFGLGQTSRSTESVKELELKPLSSQEMGKYCLAVYLDGYRKMLASGNFPQQFDIRELVEDIHHVYSSLLYRGTVQQYSGNAEVKKEASLQEVSFKVCFSSLNLAECVAN